MRKLKHTFILIGVFIVAGAVIFGIAGRGGKSDGKQTDIYFLSRDNSSILPESRTLSADSTDELCRAAIDEMLKGPSDKKHAPLMDKGVKLNGINNENGRLTVDFSDKYKNSGLLSTYAVIKTLCQISGVSAVRVTCDGVPVLQDGFISGDEINLASDDDCATVLDLYFADSDKTGLVKEYRRVNITDKQPVEQYIVAELIKGPKTKNCERLLSADTGILSVETTDGTCYVNFKQDFIAKNSAQDDIARLMIYSVVNSLTERDDVNNVQFLVDGKKTASFNGIKFEDLFYRNESLIDK